MILLSVMVGTLMNNQSDLNLPKLTFDPLSALEISLFLDQYTGDLYPVIEKLVNNSISTVFVTHRTLPNLLSLVDAKKIFNKFTSIQKNQLLSRYKFIKGIIQGIERNMTSIVNRPFDTVDTLENAVDFKYVLSNNIVLGLNARMGTGKTQLIGVPYATVCREMGITPIFIAHRISLITEIRNRTKTENYRDFQNLKVFNPELQKKAVKNGISICLNSITTESMKNIYLATNGNYAIFIDEWWQTLNAINSKDMDKPKVYAMLIELLRGAKAVIFADADLCDYAVDFIERATGRKSSILFCDKDKSHITINISLQHGDDHDQSGRLMGAAIEHLKNGYKVAFISNRARVAKAFHDEITRLNDSGEWSINAVLVGGGDHENEKGESFKSNAEKQSNHYHCISITPTITSGISIDNEDYSHVFCDFDSSSISHFDAIQQSSRFRSVQVYHVALSTRSTGQNDKLLSLEEYSEILSQYYSKDEFNPLDKVNLLIESLEKIKALSKKHFAQLLISRWLDLGYNVNISDFSAEIDCYDVITMLKEIKDSEISHILNCELISNQKMYELKAMPKVTESEKYQIIHRELRNLINMPDNELFTMFHFDICYRGYGIGSVRRNSIVNEDTNAEYMEKKEIEKNVTYDRRRLPTITKRNGQKALKLIFGTIPTNHDLFIDSMAETPKFTFSNSTLESFAQWAETEAKLNVIIGLSSSKRISESWLKGRTTKPIINVRPIQPKGRSEVAKDMLSRMGITAKSHKRNRVNGSDEHEYKIDFDSAYQMIKIGKWQKEKSEQIQKAIDEREESLKQNRFLNSEKQYENLNDDEKNTLDIFVNGTLADWDLINSSMYCLKCFTPSNHYTCSCCGSHEMDYTKNFDIHSVDKEKLRYQIFEAMKHQIITTN